MNKEIYIIGSGFSSLSAACYLAKDGHQVTILEQNDTVGGRARQLIKDGFTFDIGPTWYWMPDVFERFFADFGKTTSQYYQLKKLSPAYSVHFDDGSSIRIGNTYDEIRATFETVQPNSGIALDRFMSKAKNNYDVAIKDLVYKPGESIFELINRKTVTKAGRFFKTISSDVQSQFANKKLAMILEFPVLFLGAKPSQTPAFYSFMNYADFGLGTWYPENGMYTVVKSITNLAKELGVNFETGARVEKIEVENNKVSGIVVNGEHRKANIVLSGADYHHSESLLDKPHRSYSEKYWDSRTFAPSALLFYIGFGKKLKNIDHHMLFFDADFDQHAQDIYDKPKWPESPLFYASFPSVTDVHAAPINNEAAIFLVPLAPGLSDTEFLREEIFHKILLRLEKNIKEDLRDHIVVKESYCIKDFVKDYNSYKGNAYGMANTLKQTAFLRPKLRSQKVQNLFFTGQLTVPGPGVPPALISGKLAAQLVKKHAS
jgi:phytoene desaturase